MKKVIQALNNMGYELHGSGGETQVSFVKNNNVLDVQVYIDEIDLYFEEIGEEYHTQFMKFKLKSVDELIKWINYFEDKLK